MELKEKVLVWFLMNPYNTWMAEIEVASFFCQLDRYKDSVNCLAWISDFGLNIGETFIVCTKRRANFKSIFFWSCQSIYDEKSPIKLFFLNGIQFFWLIVEAVCSVKKICKKDVDLI